jgi:hypothetical protein
MMHGADNVKLISESIATLKEGNFIKLP